MTQRDPTLPGKCDENCSISDFIAIARSESVCTLNKKKDNDTKAFNEEEELKHLR